MNEQAIFTKIAAQRSALLESSRPFPRLSRRRTVAPACSATHGRMLNLAVDQVTCAHNVTVDKRTIAPMIPRKGFSRPMVSSTNSRRRALLKRCCSRVCHLGGLGLEARKIIAAYPQLHRLVNSPATVIRGRPPFFIPLGRIPAGSLRLSSYWRNHP